jgi:hypothetical protein
MELDTRMEQDVFLGWSGKKSEALALALKDWLPCFSGDVRPWISHHDLAPGQLWRIELAKKIKDSGSGVFCLTEENKDSVWLAFECGALSTSAQSGKIIPFLVDARNVPDPFSAFQALRATKEGTYRLLQALIGDNFGKTRDDERLFNAFWPLLSSVIEADVGSVESYLSALKDAAKTKRNLRLIKIDFAPHEAARGGTISIEYVIDAPVPDVRVWFGASFWSKPGNLNCQKAENVELRLMRGVRRYERRLTVPDDAEPGSWDLNAEVWFGPVSDTVNSYPLAHNWRDKDKPKLTIL